MLEHYLFLSLLFSEIICSMEWTTSDRVSYHNIVNTLLKMVYSPDYIAAVQESKTSILYISTSYHNDTTNALSSPHWTWEHNTTSNLHIEQVAEIVQLEETRRCTQSIKHCSSRSDGPLYSNGCLQPIIPWDNDEDPTCRQQRGNIATFITDHLSILQIPYKPTELSQLTSSITILGKSLQDKTHSSTWTKDTMLLLFKEPFTDSITRHTDTQHETYSITLLMMSNWLSRCLP